jgi:hypothetical protein
MALFSPVDCIKYRVHWFVPTNLIRWAKHLIAQEADLDEIFQTDSSFVYQLHLRGRQLLAGHDWPLPPTLIHISRLHFPDCVLAAEIASHHDRDSTDAH